MKTNRMIGAVLAAVMATGAFAADKNSRNKLLETDTAFLQSDDASRIAAQVMAYQRVTGGWPKNVDMARVHSAEELEAVKSDKERRDDSTTDNNATTMQMAFLARRYKATGDTAALASFRRGVGYLLSGQYPNGGWPQFWPEMRDYQQHITFNDNAMVNTMAVLRDIRDRKAPYDSPDIVDRATEIRIDDAFRRGVECILATQLECDGRPAVWCQQYDRTTLAPAKARAYELPSYSSMESMAIVWLLMDIPDPSPEVVAAVENAMRWFDAHKIEGYRLVRTGGKTDPGADTWLEPDSDAQPLWARFYDLENCEPFVCGRDGVPRRSLAEIEPERRNGYCWYSTYPNSLFARYERWKNEHNRQHD